MVGLHVNRVRIETKIFGPAILYPANGKGVHANKQILEDRGVPISQRLRYFDAVVSSVACFAAGHRALYKEHIQSLDLHFRKFCRSIVGPPPDIDWTRVWHEILTHLERTSWAFCWDREDTEWVSNLLWCVLETARSHCHTSHSSLDTRSFVLATCAAKAAWAAKKTLGQQIGVVLSLPRIGSLGGQCAQLSSVGATFE